MLRIFKTALIATLMAPSLAGFIVEPVHPRRPPPIVEVVPVMPAPVITGSPDIIVGATTSGSGCQGTGATKREADKTKPGASAGFRFSA